MFGGLGFQGLGVWGLGEAPYSRESLQEQDAGPRAQLAGVL